MSFSSAVMLGSFYEKTRDLERWALADLRQKDLAATSTYFDIDTPQPVVQRPRSKTHSSCFDRCRMHLPHQNDMLQLDSGGMTNGTSSLFHYHEKELTNGDTSSVLVDWDALRANEVFVPIPPGLVDAVIAAWVVLVHRYQRDAFHSLTWGLEGVEGFGETQSHTISASELDLLGIRTVTDLLNSVRRVRPENVRFETNTASVLILNDGTPEEVR
jgi:hypothetical protein